jgi:hypothetical protein
MGGTLQTTSHRKSALFLLIAFLLWPCDEERQQSYVTTLFSGIFSSKDSSEECGDTTTIS